MIKGIFCICFLVACINALPAAKPDMDPAAMAAMAGGKAIDLFETAMDNSKDVINNAFKTSENTALGMADAIKRHRRAIIALQLGKLYDDRGNSGERHRRSTKDESSSSSSSSSDCDE